MPRPRASQRPRAHARTLTLCLAAALSACGGEPQRMAVEAPRPAASGRPRGVATRTEARAHDRASIADRELLAALRRRIARDDAIPPNAIAVSIEDGTVTLAGTAPHLPAAQRARAIALSTRGVRDVISRVDVRGAARDDASVTDDARRTLELDPLLGERAIEVEVRDGVASLVGVVESLAEARLATDAVAGVRGVRAVEPALSLEPPGAPMDQDVRAAVEARLQGDARIDPAGVRVTVDQGRVSLSGAVGSALEREVARELAEVPGATDVDARGLEVQWWARDTLQRRDAPSDDEATGALRARLAADPRVRSALGARVERGVASLEGAVPSALARAAAIETALHTVGVLRVEDRVSVGAGDVEDAALADRVRERLAASAWAAGTEIEARASRGRVTLSGAAPSRTHQAAARDVVTRVAGVREVVDEIALQEDEPLEDWELVGEVRDGLVWSPFLDRMNVEVTASEGVATLRGEVDDVRAFREAEREAYDAGALRVVSELAIRGAPGRAPRTPAPSR